MFVSTGMGRSMCGYGHCCRRGCKTAHGQGACLGIMMDAGTSEGTDEGTSEATDKGVGKVTNKGTGGSGYERVRVWLQVRVRG